MVIVLILAVLLGLIPAIIAARKGRSFSGWWLYGAALWIVALPHSLAIQRRQASQGAQPGGSLTSRRGRHMQVLLSVATAAGFLFLILIFAALPVPKEARSSGAQNSPKTLPADTSGQSAAPESDATPVPTSSSEEPSEVQPTEQLFAYQLATNAYRWKGHEGILEFPMPIFGSEKTILLGFAPMPSLKFDHMVSENTAIYEVMANGEESGDELAVDVQNSDPPDASRAWTVKVIGPEDFDTRMGGTATVTEIAFLGYYTPPAEDNANTKTTPPGIGSRLEPPDTGTEAPPRPASATGAAPAVSSPLAPTEQQPPKASAGTPPQSQQ